MKIIFLDIDGVLNCVTTKERIPGSKLLLGMEDIKIRYLKEIVDRTDAKIVLTSTWKVDWFKDDKDNNGKYGRYLDSKFKEFDLLIYDKTDYHIQDRGSEIYKYLNIHNDIDKWIVIDDYIFKDYDEDIRRHLVKTTFEEGLQRKHISEAIQLLNT